MFYDQCMANVTTMQHTHESSQSPQIALKLNPLRSPLFEVTRNELCEQVFTAAATKLILIKAPDGWGKTTLMSQLKQRFEGSGIKTSWLELDRSDDHAGRFLTMLVAALESIFPDLPFENDRRVSESNPGGLAIKLLERISAHPAPFVLFIDNFESINNPAVHGLVQELINQLPRGCQLVISSQSNSEPNIPELRAKGHMIEVGPEELHLSLRETKELLNLGYALSPSDSDLRLLHRITKGCPFTLQLASLALYGQKNISAFIAQISSPDVSVIETLVDELISHQSDDMKAYLLHTCILNTIGAGIAGAVSPGGGVELFSKMISSRQFIIYIHDEHETYRYHPLFSQALHKRFTQTSSEDANKAHRAASDYLLKNGLIIPAIDHAIATGDHDYALPLLAKHANRLLTKLHMRLLAHWLKPLAKKNRLQSYPLLYTIYTWSVLFTEGAIIAEPLLQDLEKHFSTDREAVNHLFALRPTLLTMKDEIEKVDLSAMADIDKLPPEATFLHGTISLSLYTAAATAGCYDDAHIVASKMRNSHNVHYGFDTLFKGLEGNIDLIKGCLRQATKRLRSTVDPMQPKIAQITTGNALAGIILAEALYEADELEQAERLLGVYVPLIKDIIWPDLIIRSHTLLARIASGSGNRERAFDVLADLEYFGRRNRLPRAILAARLERARLLLADEDVDTAHGELQCTGDPELKHLLTGLPTRANDIETLKVASLRMQIRANRSADTIAPLLQEIETAEGNLRLRYALSVRLLCAEAMWRDGQFDRCMVQLSIALKHAEREGYIRPFIDEGETVIQILKDYLRLPTSQIGDEREFVSHLVEHAQRNHSIPQGAQRELLTKKETQVLLLLAEGLSNPKIADRLIVAETTVRTHLRNINLKLNARNRTEAVAIARRLGLIH